jgi:hypothetical protein
MKSIFAACNALASVSPAMPPPTIMARKFGVLESTIVATQELKHSRNFGKECRIDDRCYNWYVHQLLYSQMSQGKNRHKK